MLGSDLEKILSLAEKSGVVFHQPAGEGCEVDIAVNGRVAQDMIEKKQYGLCLVDIRTPKMNGKRALSVARKEISTTVLPGDIHYWGCYGWGYLGFHRAVWQAVFTKPFTPDELIAMIKEVLKPSLITE